MNTIEYLEAVRAKMAALSGQEVTDYAVSKRLGIMPSTVYRYRDGRGHMDDDTAAKVAEILGMHPGLVMLDMHRARAKTPVEASIWNDIYAGFRVPSLHAKSGRGHSPAW